MCTTATHFQCLVPANSVWECKLLKPAPCRLLQAHGVVMRGVRLSLLRDMRIMGWLRVRSDDSRWEEWGGPGELYAEQVDPSMSHHVQDEYGGSPHFLSRIHDLEVSLGIAAAYNQNPNFACLSTCNDPCLTLHSNGPIELLCAFQW